MYAAGDKSFVGRPAAMEICDVTLRDGEQTPGVAFSREEKEDIALALDAVGVEIIEAGFPAVSEAEQRAVKAVAALGTRARICALARTKTQDIDIALECDVDLLSIFTALSDLHLRHKLHLDREEAVFRTLNALDYARDHGLEVRLAAEDATRTDVGALVDYFRRGEERGAAYLSVADTVGALNPPAAYRLISQLRAKLRAPLCVHFHDDLGMATANTLCGLEAGAFQLHTTVNGIGERGGNAPLEEVLVALRLLYGVERYDLSGLCALSEKVAKYSGVAVARNKAVVGTNAFAHESGIHVAAVLEEPRTYELYSPELVGARRAFVLGKHSGVKALAHVVAGMGYQLSQERLCALLAKVKARGEEGSAVDEAVLRELIERG